MAVPGIQRPHQALPPQEPHSSKKEKPKECFEGLKDQMGSLGYESSAFTEFWGVIIKLLLNIPYVRKLAEEAWTDSVHYLQPDYTGENINLSSIGFKPPKYFTDEMKKGVSLATAKHYQRVMETFREERLLAPNSPQKRESLRQTFTSLCYSSYSDHVKGEGKERCHVALYDAIEEWLLKMPKPLQVHLGASSIQDPKDRHELSSDFLAAFCPQLEASRDITHLHIHAPFANEADRRKLLDSLEKNTSVRHLVFDLDKKSAEHILPLLPNLLENNPRITHIVFKNSSKKCNFVIEDSVWGRLAAEAYAHPHLINLRFHNTPQMPRYYHLSVREKILFGEE